MLNDRQLYSVKQTTQLFFLKYAHFERERERERERRKKERERERERERRDERERDEREERRERERERERGLTISLLDHFSFYLKYNFLTNFSFHKFKISISTHLKTTFHFLQFDKVLPPLTKFQKTLQCH